MKSKKIILIDADVVSHFITGGAITLLPTIFKNKIKILDKVYDELSKFRNKKAEVDNLLRFKLIEKIDFPEENHEIRKEYMHIKKVMFKGDGEAACLAVVRKTKDILASSNLRDIASYCKMHELDYLTTMDFLCEAKTKNIMSETDCDNFIKRVKDAGSKLPVNSMKDYNCKS
ncbi:hypothetical protein MATR_30170 [Marivirga tractuosa]|uniref:PIN domain-containing protein n=1 Tax=Marivirga tractuosa (strain ATCC 23168 / DSM 4126 / NBRC 15989 / NCIMB 1408 / VKM B-1430 / H-43) TaxID=643867 RepID=E4TV69_MARTH|nr:hypothetical protein [Marivirga tractuosa]ADR23134.1 hypothetical protein Ftrac_3159 [Marivirga tractuosa DSM 4126]BDD16192.1 hypothetical protein MATR_30170 [Marivirga tractuosa]